jgi:hypothetical protein
MKLSIPLIMGTTLIGALGLGGLIRAVLASQQEQFLGAAVPQHTRKQVLGSRSSDCHIHEVQEERCEAVKLRSLAKITQQQAKHSAEAALGGKATHVELENEDGNLVYEVLIGQTEAIVDAGNGQVLYTENENGTGASQSRSSIQVPKVDDEKDNEED